MVPPPPPIRPEQPAPVDGNPADLVPGQATVSTVTDAVSDPLSRQVLDRGPDKPFGKYFPCPVWLVGPGEYCRAQPRDKLDMGRHFFMEHAHLMTPEEYRFYGKQILADKVRRPCVVCGRPYVRRRLRPQDHYCRDPREA